MAVVVVDGVVVLVAVAVVDAAVVCARFLSCVVVLLLWFLLLARAAACSDPVCFLHVVCLFLWESLFRRCAVSQLDVPMCLFWELLVVCLLLV